MRKYILSILLILLGVLILSFNYFSQRGREYAETTFATKAQKFENVFDSFTLEVKENIFTLKGHFNDTLIIRDTISTRNYCLDQLDGFSSLNSIAIFQNDYKLIVRKDNESRIYAVDSTSGINVVKWRRYEKGKQVSSWYESFHMSLDNTDWYQELLDVNDQLRWYLRNRVKSENPNEFIYAGYSYNADGQKTIILLEFSRDKLLSHFNLSKENLNLRLSFMNAEGRELNVDTAVSKKQDTITSRIEEKDSLQMNIVSHFSKFKEVPRGTFNFNYNNEVYWNSFKRFSQDSGLQYYLLTVSNSELQNNSKGFLKGILSYVALGLILGGLVLLFIRKRFFYRANRMQIPSVSKILEDDENRYLEFKSSLRWDYRQEKSNPELEKVIMKTIAAFGNTDGGILLLGVDDDKNIIGLEKDFQTLKKSDADYYEVHLRNLMHKMMGVKYASKFIRTQFEVFEDQKIVCKIKVISADEPLYLKYTNKNGQAEEKFYVRSGNSSHEIESIAEINDYINKKFK